MQLIGEAIVNSLVIGSTYAIIASGFAMIFGVSRVLNFAHGDIFMFASMLIYVFVVLAHIPYPISLVIVVIIGALLGALVERFLFRPFVAPAFSKQMALIVVAVGLMFLIAASSFFIFGEQDRRVPAFFSGVVHLGNVALSMERLAIVLISAALLVGLQLFIQRTGLGRALRAVAWDAESASVHGINVNRIRSAGFMIGCGLTAMAAGLIAPLYYVNVFMGIPILVKTLIVIVIGGLGGFTGALVGGLTLGFIEGFGYTFIGGQAELIAFILVIVILVVRPYGIAGIRGID